MKRVLRTILLLIWLDRLVNFLLMGSIKETLSSRAHRMRMKGQPVWGWTANAIDRLFFWQPNHCARQWAYEHPQPGQERD